MKVFSVSQIQKLDQYTIVNEPVSSIDLMERASHAFVEHFIKEINRTSRIIIFAGPGNNGGDALAIARLLSWLNYQVIIYLFNPQNRLSPDGELNKTKLIQSASVVLNEFHSELPMIKINKGDILIDGLFGSGLNRPLTGLVLSLVHIINESEAKVYAIDIPSGLFGENNEGNLPYNKIVKATKTFTFQSPKLAFFMPDTSAYVGEWKVLDIQLHADALREFPSEYYLTEKEDIKSLIHKRGRFAYKNKYGHALIIAGSEGKMGAAILSSMAALRAGAGLVSSHIPARGESILQTAFPEGLVNLDSNSDVISDFLDLTLNNYASIGLGPGIGTRPETVNTIVSLFEYAFLPMVVDADALNIISENKHLKDFINHNMILTPHVGEFNRLAGDSKSDYSRLEKARDYASETKAIIVLKGAYTAVCLPDRTVHFNPTGNPGMATAGSGDVLTGIITGLLAQSYSLEEAAKIGVYIHGLAGDIAARKKSEYSLIARDIIDNLGEAYKELMD